MDKSAAGYLPYPRIHFPTKREMLLQFNLRIRHVVSYIDTAHPITIPLTFTVTYVAPNPNSIVLKALHTLRRREESARYTPRE
jgi:hypothetical protein